MRSNYKISRSHGFARSLCLGLINLCFGLINVCLGLIFKGRFAFLSKGDTSIERDLTFKNGQQVASKRALLTSVTQMIFVDLQCCPTLCTAITPEFRYLPFSVFCRTFTPQTMASAPLFA